MLQKRKSTGDLIRGVRTAARLLLSYGADGALQLRVENALALEMPQKPAWSNSTVELNGGWPSYEFGDGSNGFSGIVRRSNGEPSFRLYSRSMADTPNRFQRGIPGFVERIPTGQFFAGGCGRRGDASGQEVSQTLPAVGLPNFDQAARILKLNLDRSVRGNTYIEFETSVKAFGIRPGDLITVTYLKEGLTRQLFRVLKIAPGTNHRITRSQRRFMTIRGTPTATDKSHREAADGVRATPESASRIRCWAMFWMTWARYSSASRRQLPQRATAPRR